MAEGPGFEPGLTGPEPVVLPLDDPSVCGYLIINTYGYEISQVNFFQFLNGYFSDELRSPRLLTFTYSQSAEGQKPCAALLIKKNAHSEIGKITI